MRKATSIKGLHAQSVLWTMGNHGMQEADTIARFSAELSAIRARNKKSNQEQALKDPEGNRVRCRARYAAKAVHYQELARQSRERRKSDPERLDAYRKYCRDKMAERLRSDPEFRIRFRMRNRIWMSLQRGVAKKGPTVEMLGCSMGDYRRYLEALWLPGMSWDNYGRGGWHIDHKRALAKFDLNDPEERKRAFHHTNTQPLWERDNLSKGDTV